jgi:anthranilate phosphoribosyltransferase
LSYDETALRAFGADVQRLIDGHDLGRARTYELFRETLLGEQPDLQQGALLAALVAKGETPGEIAGAWQAIVEYDTVAASVEAAGGSGDVPAGVGEGEPAVGPLVENSGTGMDALKTFNVSSAAAIIAAAAGARLARHGARALTSKCGAVDILEAVGVDVECDVATVERSIASVGIGIFNGMSPQVHPGGLGRILSQIRFGSTLNIAASLANPVRPTHGVRGVYAEGLLAPVGDVMLEIGYEHALVVHGFDARREAGMDELSVLGPSVVSELRADGRRDAYTVEPEDFGMRRAAHAEIAPLDDLHAEATRFVQVLGGRGHEACGDAACLNAAAVLYVAGRSADLGDGLAQAREAVASGAALSKLEEWVAAQAGGLEQRHAGEARLTALCAEAGRGA